MGTSLQLGPFLLFAYDLSLLLNATLNIYYSNKLKLIPEITSLSVKTRHCKYYNMIIYRSSEIFQQEIFH